MRSLGEESDTEVKFGQYKFYTNSEPHSEYLVDIYNWHDVLKKEKSETLDLWVKNSVPDLTFTKDTNYGETSTKWPANLQVWGHDRRNESQRWWTNPHASIGRYSRSDT